MTTNRSIEGLDLDTIQHEAGVATRNAVNLLYQAINAEIQTRRVGVRLAQDAFAPKILTEAFTAGQNNFNLRGYSVLLCTGTAAVDLTGFLAPGTGASHLVVILVIGSGTHTIKHASASSDATNRIRTNSLGDVALATDDAIMLLYANSLWRELNKIV